ncbi:MAG: MATE family efflux transporter, partial [Succinatimonas sp.]|nr:MATE family efflux transporter [Succinatimonas sp.]
MSIEKNNLQSMPSLFQISWPIFIDLGLHFSTLMINLAMVGMVSVDAVAELTVGNQVFDLGFILFNFINIGVCVVCAQALGNGNLKIVRRVVHMGLGLNFIWGAIVSLAVFSCS